MKTCTLGIIYGLTFSGLVLYLDVPVHQAKGLQRRFMAMFPGLKQALDRTSVLGTIRGYASTVTGLRRYRGTRRRVSRWERNWLTNLPVQGTAAAIFKDTGNRLYSLYQQFDAWLIVPFHDAFVFEAPSGA